MAFLNANSSLFLLCFFFRFEAGMYHKFLINFANKHKKKRKKNKSLKAFNWVGIESYRAKKSYVWKLHKKSAIEMKIRRFRVFRDIGKEKGSRAESDKKNKKIQ